MGGQEAIRGFEYQFLRTLEYAFEAMLDTSSAVTGIYVESPPPSGPDDDSEAVDFAVYRNAECLIKAQVKTTGAAQFTASAAVAVLLRLISGPADTYLLLVTRPATGEFGNLCAALEGSGGSDKHFKDSLLSLVRRSNSVAEKLRQLDEEGWRRLRRCRIAIDNRSVFEIRRQMRETVRHLRRKYRTGSPGWDAAGLLLGHLLWDVLSAAADPGVPLIPLDSIRNALAMDDASLAAAVAGRKWALNVGAPPRLTDVARPELIDRIAETLVVPNPTPQVPVCVLHGLSGIGKTSLAAAWANDRSDDYAVIFWIDSATAESIDGSFRNVDRWIQANVQPQPVEQRLHARIQAGLARITVPWLIVFDNAPDSRHIKRWLPSAGVGHGIVTTTDPSSWNGAHIFKLEVPTMTESQAITLLLRRMRMGLESMPPKAQVIKLADHLLRWPLALELASAYLVDTHEGLAGMADYERLVRRALDDDDSIPPGYPSTLVGAVLLAMRRMERRGETDDAASVARMALRFAAFMQPRHIPFHLLMANVFVHPEEDVREVAHSFAAYSGADPPAGEILREMLRGSLVAIDAPIFGGVDERVTVQSFDFSVGMNEIVQEVIRNDVSRENAVAFVVTQAGYHSQRWLQHLIDADRHDLALVFKGHCVYLARAALRHDISNYATALLWGNAATALGLAEEWREAEVYLRAELAYLRSTNDRLSPTMAVGTYAQLALAIMRQAARAIDIVDEVCDLLDEVVAWHARATPADGASARTPTFGAFQVAYNLGVDLPDHRRVKDLAGVLLALVSRDDSADPKASVAMDVHSLGERLRANDNLNQLITDIELRLQDSAYMLHWTTLRRFSVEARMYKNQYGAAAAIVRDMSRYAALETFQYSDVETLLSNVAHHCLSFAAEGSADALEVLVETCNLAERYLAGGRALRPGDQARLDIVRAYLALYQTDFLAMIERLEGVNRRDVEAIESGRKVGVADVHWLMCRWVETLPEPVARAVGRSRD